MQFLRRRKSRDRSALPSGPILPALSVKARCLILASVALLSGLAIWLSDGQLLSAQGTAKKDKDKATAASLRPIPGAGQKLDAAALAKVIDGEVQRRLDAEKIKPSAKADDAEFLRRVYLDLIGVIPPRDKAAAFLDSKDPNKRAKLVDELLANPRFGTSLAEMWTELMLPRDSNNRRTSPVGLQEWLTKRFNENQPWDKIVYDLVTSSGDMAENGAVTYFVANNTMEKMTGSVTKLFMGVQLQCAQCHNHPFTNYKQDDFWSTAAFFSRVKAADQKKAAKAGTPVTVTENAGGGGGKGFGKKKAVDGYRNLPPKYLQGTTAKVTQGEPFRPVFAKWLTATDNPFFARAFANRMWHHFVGRGFVNPVDDMHGDNPATHPELVTALAEQFRANGFDVKYLMRAIVLSDTYQRSSRPAHGNEADTELYSHMPTRVMTPFQLYDSLTSIVGAGNFGGKGGFGKGGGGGKKGGGPGGREGFVTFFISENPDATEYEAGIPQVLRLMNSPMLNNTGPTVSEAMKGASTPQVVIERLYLTALARRPTEVEMTRRLAYVNRPGGGGAQQSYGDILWALLNSSEFTMNH